jgi:hypothetical protein
MPAAARATTLAAEGTTAGDAKKGAPGFTAVFAIAGVCLQIAYAMMRHREWAAAQAMMNEGGDPFTVFLFLFLWQVLQGGSPAARHQSSTRCTSARTCPTITDIYPPAIQEYDDQ